MWALRERSGERCGLLGRSSEFWLGSESGGSGIARSGICVSAFTMSWVSSPGACCGRPMPSSSSMLSSDEEVEELDEIISACCC